MNGFLVSISNQTDRGWDMNSLLPLPRHRKLRRQSCFGAIEGHMTNSRGCCLIQSLVILTGTSVTWLFFWIGLLAVSISGLSTKARDFYSIQSITPFDQKFGHVALSLVRFVISLNFGIFNLRPVHFRSKLVLGKMTNLQHSDQSIVPCPSSALFFGSVFLCIRNLTRFWLEFAQECLTEIGHHLGTFLCVENDTKMVMSSWTYAHKRFGSMRGQRPFARVEW